MAREPGDAGALGVVGEVVAGLLPDLALDEGAGDAGLLARVGDAALAEGGLGAAAQDLGQPVGPVRRRERRVEEGEVLGRAGLGVVERHGSDLLGRGMALEAILPGKR
ncbi:hypothetical protein [Rubellimicrobium aerolatum]|uniref:Uncharacterized protein n=1 Tax=Rubellimicrobium aerolatum TaxID=490979 RepID=A0ABW0S8W5_9RHOB|nr:hypothetical protein [Rubellimicrobium aerolatum]MBP1804728.1 hypothetical protein [Rubellimicrobium aerolatum]